MPDTLPPVCPTCLGTAEVHAEPGIGCTGPGPQPRLVIGNALADYEADLTLPPETTLTPPEAAVTSHWFERLPGWNVIPSEVPVTTVFETAGDPVEGLPGSPERARLDALDTAARARCEAHQAASPTRIPCAACTQQAAKSAWIADRVSEIQTAVDAAWPIPTVFEAAEHFHGCPDPTGRPFDCDWCQDRARGMSGE